MSKSDMIKTTLPAINEPPPPYDVVIEEYSVPYIDPPLYKLNPIEYERIKLQKFKTKYYLPNHLHIYKTSGASHADYSELFWGPEGKEEYDSYQDGLPNLWLHRNRINQVTEYYDPKLNWGERDSVLRLNNRRRRRNFINLYRSG